MLRYIFISVLFFIIIVANAQYTNSTSDRNTQDPNKEKEGTPKVKKEKIPYPNKKRGLSLGIDASKFFIPLMDEDRFSIETNIRTNFKKRMFLVGELGFENISYNDISYSKLDDGSEKIDGRPYEYSSNGIFVRAGLDYDIFIVEEENNNDNILIGFRYGFAIQEHQAPLYVIEDSYWGNINSSVSPYSVSSHWIELIGGLRTELFNNFYLSWLVRVKSKLYSSNKEVLLPYRIPGYGKGSKAISLGFSYNLEYQIPWGNKKRNTKLPAIPKQ